MLGPTINKALPCALGRGLHDLQNHDYRFVQMGGGIVVGQVSGWDSPVCNGNYMQSPQEDLLGPGGDYRIRTPSFWEPSSLEGISRKELLNFGRN